MITAKEALEKSLNNNELEIIEKAIKYAEIEILKNIKLGKTEAILSNNFFLKEAYNNSPQFKIVVKKLKKLGYMVDFYYQEMSMAVDMYTIIKWDNLT